MYQSNRSDKTFKLCLLAASLIAVQLGHAATNGATTKGESIAAKQTIEDMVVTAQRREANMQEVPAAITAVPAEELHAANVDSLSNIQLLSPSVKFDVSNSAANSANIMIRGIGTIGNNRAFEGAVGVFVDGVYRIRAGQAMQNWLDVESLQILRGPQGTLFGKNTSAGALLITSKNPSTEGFAGDYEITAGNYGKFITKAAINTPIDSTQAIRIAGMWGIQDGYIENPNGGDYNDRNPTALKAQYLYEPSQEFKLHVITDWSDEESNCCYGQVLTTAGAGQPLIDYLIAARGLTVPSANIEDYEQVLSHDTEQSIKDQGILLNVEWLISEFSMTSVTSYREWDFSQENMDADFSGINLLAIDDEFAIESFSQEFTLNGEADLGPFATDYVLGIYFARDKIDSHYELSWEDEAQRYYDTLRTNGVAPFADLGVLDASPGEWSDATADSTNDSYALFTHWNFQLTEAVGMSAGIRYSSDEKDVALQYNYYNPATNDVFRALAVQPGPDYRQTFKDEAISGSLTAHMKINADLMIYASYNRGYKAGGINIDNTAAGTWLDNPDNPLAGVTIPLPTTGDLYLVGSPLDPSYKSEFVDGYEMGIKADYWDNRARTNFALFYNDIEDLQNARFVGTRFDIDNIPEATVYGAEVENQFLLTEQLSVDASLTYLAEAEFGQADEIADLSGREFAHSPEFAGNLSATYEQDLTPTLGFVARVGAAYQGEAYTNTSNNQQESAQTLYNASLGLLVFEEDLSVTLWCQNCTDERFITQHFNSPLQERDGTATHGYVAAPKTFGLTLRGSL